MSITIKQKKDITERKTQYTVGGSRHDVENVMIL